MNAKPGNTPSTITGVFGPFAQLTYSRMTVTILLTTGSKGKGAMMKPFTDTLLDELEALKQKQQQITDDLKEIQFNEFQSARELFEKQAKETDAMIKELQKLQ